MEELAAAAAPPRHRERRRHRRKASSTDAAAAYGDVFGGPPQFAVAFDGVPADYGEVFGGVAASCSIPYLDLPPAAARDDGAGAGAYGEIFGRFDFGDFAEPYEDLLAEAVALAAEIASSSESSRYEFPSSFYLFFPRCDICKAHCSWVSMCMSTRN